MDRHEKHKVLSPAEEPKNYTVNWLYEDSNGQKLLDRFHRKKPWICLCNNKELKLWAFFRGQRYWLKVASHEGPEHHPACCFYTLRSDFDQTSQFTEKARREDPETGNILISCAIALNTRDGGARNPREIRAEHFRINKRYRKMTGLGFLQDLWQGAELNTWRPWFKGKRTWHAVINRVSHYADGIIYNRTPLSQRLAFAGNVDGSCSEKQLSYFYGSVINPLKLDEHKRFFILGVIGSSEKTDYGYLLSFQNSSLKLYTDVDVYALYQERYHRAKIEFDYESGRPIFLVVVSWKTTQNKTRQYLFAHEIISMPVTDEYIPFDSSYERNVIKELIAEERFFVKPLKMDPEDSVLADFVLTDTYPETAMEVFGMVNNEAYDERKREKISLYQTNKTPLWQWIPYEEPMPKFPNSDTRDRE